MPHAARIASQWLIAALIAGLASFANAGNLPSAGDVPYGPDPAQRFDLYAPPDATDAPLILMVHGGGWTRGDKNMSRVVDNKRERWLPFGIAFATLNYRLQPVAPPLEQARDVALALATIQRNSARFGVDRQNIVLMGHSAGAHLIALLAARPELLVEAGAEPPQGFVLLDSGALDVPAIMQNPHYRLYDRAFGDKPADWLAASPYHQMRRATAPILAVCSSRRADACPQARAFVAKAHEFGTKAEVLPLNLSHGEINQRLGKDPVYTASVERFISELSGSFSVRLR